ncbi:MAG: hypothetical protein Q9167_007443 [Letrouitia subvulpina]
MLSSNLFISFLPFLSSFVSSSAIPSLQTLSPRVCGTIVPPSNYYQIYEETAFENQTSGLGPLAPDGGFNFAVSQKSSNVNERDLIASFKNIPCGHGPYNIEFSFVPDSQYRVSGSNTRVDVYAIYGNLPTLTSPDGSVSEVPTWTNQKSNIGPLIGTFSFPTGEEVKEAMVFFINSVDCRSTINLRLSVTNDNAGAGDITYFHGTDVGLRVRYGC